MKTVRVERAELLRKLKANREQHNLDYQQAREGFHGQYLSRLNEMRAEAIERRSYAGHTMLQEPRNYSSSYDIEIAMLEMSQDEVIELEVQDFRRYVLDDWEWAESFKNLVTSYTASR